MKPLKIKSVLQFHLLVLLCLTAFQTAFSQVKPLYPEALKEQITKHPDDVTKANLMIELGNYYLKKPGELEIDLNKAQTIQKQAKTLCENLRYDLGTAKSMLLEGEIFCERKEPDKSIRIIESCITYCKTRNFNQLIGTAYQLISFNFSNAGKDLDKRIFYTSKAILYFAKTSDRVTHARVLETLGDLYMLKSENVKSLNILKQSLSIYNSIGFKQTQGVYNLIGYVSKERGDNINALKYLLTALKVAESQKDTTAMLVTIYNRLGMVYQEIGRTKESISVLKKGIVLSEKANDSTSTAYLKLNLLSAYLSEKSYKAADQLLKDTKTVLTTAEYSSSFFFGGAGVNLYLKNYKQALIYIDSLQKLTLRYPEFSPVWQYYYSAWMKYDIETANFQDGKQNIMNKEVRKRFHSNKGFLMSYEKFGFKIDSALGNPVEALDHFKNYSHLKDSLTKAENARQLSELQLQFETERKDENILLLTQKSEVQQSQIRSQALVRNSIIGGLVVLLIFSGLLYNRYRIKQLANVQLESKQLEINIQNELLKKTVTEKEWLLTEKEWLLKEIHHRVKNNLQIITSLLHLQGSFLKDKEALTAIQESRNRVHAMAVIHQKLYQTDRLSSIPMANYIHEIVDYLINSFDRGGTINKKIIVSEIDLDVTFAVPLGLILNEAVTNSLKYAFPNNRIGTLNIELIEEENKIYRFVVGDDGIGFPVDLNQNQKRTLGMSLIKGLSEQIDGTLIITHAQGVQISLEFIDDKIERVDTAA